MVGDLLLGLLAGALVAAVRRRSASRRVFLLPIQLSVLQVPNPSVTPTNLLYNVIAAPGALFRTGVLATQPEPSRADCWSGPCPEWWWAPSSGLPPARRQVVPGHRRRRPADHRRVAPQATLAPPSKVTPWPARRLVAVAFAVGIVGGVYGVGGGSLLSPLLVGSGMAVAAVAPAALASTFVTSVVGALGYGVLSLFADGSIAPDWPLGIACGLGGLVGGYVGALLQPRVPERGLRYLLGGLAAVIGIGYLVQGLG